MASRYVSNAGNYRRDFRGQVLQRVRAASIYLSARVKADVSQAGTLRYSRARVTKTKGGYGVVTGSTLRTVYNFTHSRPGNPPFKQKGTLRRSIAYEVLAATLAGRVGSGIKNPRYPYYLELGTRKMAARPYLRRALVVHRAALVAILTRKIPPGGLPPVASNQFRSGHFGRGAAAAGWN